MTSARSRRKISKRANHLMYLTSFLGLVFFAGIRAVFYCCKKKDRNTTEKEKGRHMA